MSLDDDLVEIRGLHLIQTPQTEVIHDEQVRSEQTSYGFLSRVVGPRLVQLLQHLIGSEKEHSETSPAGGVTEATSQECLADTDWAEEENVFGPLDEAQAEEVAHPVTIESDRSVPIEVFEGAHFLEARSVESMGEIGLLAPVDFILERQFEEVLQVELRLLCIGHPIGERRQDPGELEAFENGLEGRLDLHRGRSPSRYGSDDE